MSESDTWSKSDVALLKAEWVAGRSASEIAAQLPGRTRGAVCSKAHRLGIFRSDGVRREPYNPADPDQRAAALAALRCAS